MGSVHPQFRALIVTKLRLRQMMSLNLEVKSRSPALSFDELSTP